MYRFTLACLLVALLPAGAPGEPSAVTKMLSIFDRLHQIQNHGNPGEPYRFELSEQEVNEYLGHSLKKTPRPGVEKIRVKFMEGNYLSMQTTVDFDAIEDWRPGSVPPAMRKLLKGRKSVWVDVRFVPNGRGLTIFVVEKAYLDSIRIPAIAVQKMIEVVAERQPEKYDLSKPIPLPFGLRTIEIEKGRASGGT